MATPEEIAEKIVAAHRDNKCGIVPPNETCFEQIRHEIIDALTAAEQVRAGEWQMIETAPKDGSTIIVPIEGTVAAFWCNDLRRWVLNNPLHMESINPLRYRLANEPWQTKTTNAVD